VPSPYPWRPFFLVTNNDRGGMIISNDRGGINNRGDIFSE
jgi:hypothetical protein